MNSHLHEGSDYRAATLVFPGSLLPFANAIRLDLSLLSEIRTHFQELQVQAKSLQLDAVLPDSRQGLLQGQDAHCFLAQGNCGHAGP